MTNTYTILEEKREDVEKKLKRLQKKADKYNAIFSVAYGDPYAIEIEHKDDFGKKYTNKYEVFDLTIESDIIRKDGYTVLAHIEHADNGNIVNVFSGEVQKEWITMKPFCAHCNANHNLHYTFIVANGDDKKQVGRTCLKDYCGIDPQTIGMFNQFFEEIEEDTAEGYDFHEPIPMVYDAVDILAHAIAITEEQGYVKSDEPNSNKSHIIKECSNYPKEEHLKKATEMAESILSLSLNEAIDARLNNVQSRLKGFYCKPSDFGYFAYAPTAYTKMMERKAREERRNAEKAEMGAKSEYIGTIGERILIEVKDMRLLTSFFTDYGTTLLYRFIDKNDNVLIWFASSPMGKWIDNGDGTKRWKETTEVCKIKATVKAHNERDGVKQTILTRVKEI